MKLYIKVMFYKGFIKGFFNCVIMTPHFGLGHLYQAAKVQSRPKVMGRKNMRMRDQRMRLESSALALDAKASRNVLNDNKKLEI